MFSLNQKRLIDTCNGIVARGFKVTWRCETRIEFLKSDTLKAMAQARCEGIKFGVESSDVEIRKNIGRRPLPNSSSWTPLRCAENLASRPSRSSSSDYP
jgi:radical SAM superfamily enzyme YgiQ (UPF0313 family)